MPINPAPLKHADPRRQHLENRIADLVLLAFWVSGSDRVYALAQRTFLTLFRVGLVALFRGFTQIMLAFVVHHAGEQAAVGEPPARR